MTEKYELSSSIAYVKSQSNGDDLLFYSALPSVRSEVEKAIFDVMDLLAVIKKRGFAPHVTENDFRLVLDEALENALVHGNRSDPGKHIRVRIIFGRNRINLIIKDEGEGFDMDTVSTALSEENILRPHGRGILLMRTIANAHWNNKGNIVTLFL